MSAFNFDQVINETIDELYSMSRQQADVIRSCKDGTDFEKVVKEAVSNVKSNKGYSFSIIYDEGSHRFPDIILECNKDEKYGIEVKSTTSATAKNWKINGNSILGSTKDESVIETYIVFGKTKQLEFMAGKYSDCISDIAVTHSPRYLIDMELNESDNFFAKSGIKYEALTVSDDPIKMITSYYRKQGKQAWWIAEETAATIQYWNDLSAEEQDYCLSYGFVHFPELFSNKQAKYKRFAAWLVAAKGAITTSLRDCFSASGRVSLTVNERSFSDLPHIYKTLEEHIPTMKKIFAESDIDELHEDWMQVVDESIPDGDIIHQWAYCVGSYIKDEPFIYGLSPTKYLLGFFKKK